MGKRLCRWAWAALGEDVLDSIGQRVESERWNAEKALGDDQQLLAKDPEFHLRPQEDEPPHPLREAADHLPTLFRHSTVPILRAGRWNQEHPLPKQPCGSRRRAS